MLLLFMLLGTFLFFSFVHFASKSKKPFLRAFLSIGLGIGSLFAVNLLSSLTSVYIPVTTLSVMTSALGGMPGTALLVMLTVL